MSLHLKLKGMDRSHINFSYFYTYCSYFCLYFIKFMHGWSHNRSSNNKQRFLTKQETAGLTYEERKFAEEQFK